MAAWIISTAQQARPKVIHISDPVRAQLIKASALATRKPLRSEERRVGKECRSLCDWSSDVCSSDLHHLDSAAGETKGHPHQRPRAGPVDQGVRIGDEKALEIGRASCRERV